ncbi:leucine aminopeptidase 1, partial [Aspergillus nomiae NRRL 13137]
LYRRSFHCDDFFAISMKIRAALALSATASAGVLAAVIPQQALLNNPQIHYENTKYLIELAPYQTRWVTEEEKWALKLDGVNFIDITEERNPGFYPTLHQASNVRYPTKMDHVDEVVGLTRGLTKANMERDLEKFTSFHTRYYKSQTGIESATWLYNQVQTVIEESGAAEHGATVDRFAHPWGQFSVIARIPGKSNKTIVLGAHQDITILEALRGLLQSDTVAQGKAPNTIEFHWYSAEEGGMLGSQAIFSQYKQERRDIKAMLQQDMTGYIQGALNAGRKEAVGIMIDYVDRGLTQFLKDVVTAYCNVGYLETKCGYACSDHTSASKYGYPSAMATEAEMENTNKRIHTTDDRIKYLSFDHMLEHAKLTLGFAYELAFASF